jgi:hypothetical protein
MSINFNSQTLILNSQMTDKPKVETPVVIFTDGSKKEYPTTDTNIEEKLNDFKETWNTAHPDNQIDKIER